MPNRSHFLHWKPFEQKLTVCRIVSSTKFVLILCILRLTLIRMLVLQTIKSPKTLKNHFNNNEGKENYPESTYPVDRLQSRLDIMHYKCVVIIAFAPWEEMVTHGILIYYYQYSVTVKYWLQVSSFGLTHPSLANIIKYKAKAACSLLLLFSSIFVTDQPS